MDQVLFLGILMTVGFLAGKLADRIGLPRVAAYVAVGVLFSENLLGSLVPAAPGEWSDRLTHVALGVIAFLVGAEIEMSRLFRLGRTVSAITLGQTLGAVLVVMLALWGLAGLFGPPVSWETSLIFGAIAIATAPAATLAVIEEYRARGDLTSILLGIIAIDDAVGILVFTVAIALAGGTALTQQLSGAAFEILFAIVVGLVLGIILGRIGRQVEQTELRLTLITGFILMNLGLAGRFHFSELLSSMLLGLSSRFTSGRSLEDWLAPITSIRETIFLIFFTLAGTHFQTEVFLQSLWLVGLFVAARAIGKYSGAWLFATAAGATATIRNYSGLTLMPQAGVAVGLALRATAEPQLQAISSVLLNTIIGSTVIFALTAPWLTKFALTKAGEISSHTKD